MAPFGADPAFVASPSSQQAVSTKGFNPGEGRPLSVVIAEMMLAEAELKRLDARIGSNDPSEIEDARWAKLEDTIWLRRDEAKAIIEAATGVSWSAIEGANL